MAELDTGLDVDAFLHQHRDAKPSTKRNVTTGDAPPFLVPNKIRRAADGYPTAADVANTHVDDYDVVAPNADLRGR